MSDSVLSIEQIRTDGGTQPRSMILRETVEEYAAAMVDGAVFPPVTVFYDGREYWLADGFHRLAASEAAGLTKVQCDIRQGTRREAILHSVGANATHGMRRTNEDKRRAVRVLLEDQEWSQWSDREIARRCGVDHKTVANLRPALKPDTGEIPQYEPRTFIHPKTGQPTQMRTANIGSAPRPVDRPVFDNTAFAEQSGNWSPADISPAPARPSRDASGDYIHHALTEILRQFERLPTPSVAAEHYPVDLSHALPVSVVNSIAGWFSEFAPVWSDGHADRDQWARNILNKVKENSSVGS